MASKKTKAKRFYAVWILPKLEVMTIADKDAVSLDDFHISAGIDSEKDNIEDQVPGYFHEEKGSRLTIKRLKDGEWKVKLSVLTLGLEKQDGYWLSPSLVYDKFEAIKWGLEK